MRSSRVVPLAAAVTLLVAAPPVRCWEVLAGGGSTAAAPDALLVAAVGLLAWLLTAWLLVVAVLTSCGQASGVVGRAARSVLRWTAPRAVRRAMTLALGTAAVLSPAAPALAADAPSFDWPVSAVVATPAVTGDPSPTTASPAAARPAPSESATSTAQPVPAASRSTATLPTPAVPAITDPASGVPLPSTAPHTVVVRPGDTLWDLAAADLGPTATPARVAAAWPSWWEGNREAIGPDPDLLQVGTRLTPP